MPRLTDTYIQQIIDPKLTSRDRHILGFLHDHRIVTSEQLARTYWPDRKQSQWLCNRRLRILSGLGCIQRHYPVTCNGRLPAHITLETAGAKVLGATSWARINQLPISYRHTVLVTEFSIRATRCGICKGLVEYDLGGVRADLYYPDRQTAVEIDTGSESQKCLQAKAEGYRRLQNVRQVVLVTQGTKDRLTAFLTALGGGVGAEFANLDKLLVNLCRSFASEQRKGF